MLIRAAVVVVVTLLLGPAAVAQEGPAPVKEAASPAPEIDAADEPAEAEDAAVDVVAPVVRAPPPPEPMETLVGMPSAADMVMPFIKTMLMLGVVLALVWLTLHKGMGKLVEKAQSGKRVRVVERISLDARRTLFLVEVDGKQMILAGGDVVRIGEVDALAPAQKTERQSLFDKVMVASGRPPRPTTTTTIATTAQTETERAS